MAELTIQEIKMRAVEVAERTIHQPYISSPASGVDNYRDKDVREVLRNADRIVAYVTGTENDAPQSLIAKLKDVLCDKNDAR